MNTSASSTLCKSWEKILMMLICSTTKRDFYRDHFDYEEKQFMACGEPCDADAHKKKHDIFFKTLTWVTNPVSQEYVAFAKNWLAQHIKNTDFKYRYKLATQHKTPEPYVWNNEFEVFVSNWIP